ncbi:hypothetical protein H2201_007183 [Coniosporium apollinis]|uniref:Uncharacterized protein n=2 Tax=Coniosporium TaxID=2810619 RepID=A0ABQ9NK35_9PEZI|nr:hypothetical protein H2199_002000 [Cladosporium sp. JES 115]KAJ9659747.1 hypothetical protein H2201_007183 [Coniosporium apollinis]
MAPTRIVDSHLVFRADETNSGSWRKDATDEAFILEGWSEGFMVGALIIMSCVTVANMRRGVLLHKLILFELLLAITHGTFCFMSFDGYGWYLSSTAALLYCSYFLHNVVAWIKIKPFFTDSRSLFQPKTGKIVSRVYLITLAMTIPPILLQIVNNFRFFNNINDFYREVRPTEPLFR